MDSGIDIELYGMGSPNVRKIVIMLEELDLRWRGRHVAVFRGAQFDDAFRRLNPLRKVPVLIDHNGVGAGRPIFESGAILIYLAETYGKLLPASGPARYEVLEWLIAQVANIGPMFGQHNHFLLMPEAERGYAGRRYREQATRLYRILDDRLAESEWLGGDTYSIADIATYPWALYVERHGLAWADHPALTRWCEAMAARPGVVRSEAAMAVFNTGDSRAIQDATPADFDRFFWREASGPAPDFSSMTG